MRQRCLECGNQFIPEKHNYSRQKYCSKKCRQGYMNRDDRRSYEDRKEYLRSYQQKYYHKNPKQKQRCLERNKTLEAKEYRKKWAGEHSERLRSYNKKFRKSEKGKNYRAQYRETEKFKRYQKDWVLKNPDKVRARYKRYSKTDKGIWNSVLKLERRRGKHKTLSGRYYDNHPNLALKKYIDARDRICVYCGREFNLSDRKRTYDHLNPNLPLIKENAVVCCSYCNSSKQNREVSNWLKAKGYTPAPIVYELLEKQLITRSEN